MSIVWKILKIVGSLIAIGIGGFILLIWAGLAWIAYKPLPPLPPTQATYEVSVLTLVPERSGESWGVVFELTDSGKIVEKILPKDRSWSRYKMPKMPKGNHFERNRRTIQVSISKTGKSYQIPLFQVDGYKWAPYCDFDFVSMNESGRLIGSTVMATGCASSGGTSSPHGRRFPIFWEPSLAKSIDLNIRIDSKSGWYLFYAWDINEAGQILCTAAKTDIRGAEDWRGERRFVLLTPIKSK